MGPITSGRSSPTGSDWSTEAIPVGTAPRVELTDSERRGARRLFRRNSDPELETPTKSNRPKPGRLSVDDIFKEWLETTWKNAPLPQQPADDEPGEERPRVEQNKEFKTRLSLLQHGLAPYRAANAHSPLTQGERTMAATNLVESAILVESSGGSPNGSGGSSGSGVMVGGPPRGEVADSSPLERENSPPPTQAEERSCKAIFLGRVSNITQEVVFGVGNILLGVVSAFAYVITGVADLTIGIIGALFGYEAQKIEKALTDQTNKLPEGIWKITNAICKAIGNYFAGEAS